MKLKKGDEVVVITGSDKGRRGKILRVLPREDKVIVAGVNLKTKHQKPIQNNPTGSVERIEAPIHVSNVAAWDAKEGGPSRIGYRFENGKKVRYLKRSGTVLD